MKKFKKVLALALALALALSLSMPVFAAEETDDPTPTPTPLPTTGHDFTAYQIFSGEYEDGVLVKIDWGDAIENPTTFINALKADSAFGEGENNAFAKITAENTAQSADAVARVVADWADNSDMARAFARVVYANLSTSAHGYKAGDDIPAGYYLVVDTTTEFPEATDVRNLSILAFVTDGTFNPTMKVDVPELNKEVLEVNDSVPVDEDKAWGDTADYDVGDNVSFKLTGTIPDDYDEYDVYKYVFHDTMSSGLKFNGDIKVTVNGQEIQPGENTYTVVTEDIDETFQVVFNDLKQIPSVQAGSVIVVTYTAELTEGAVVKQENEAYLEFSNDPNHRGGGTPPTGTTPKDKVTVFTFKLAVDKIDGEGAALSGAGFTLYKWNADAEGEDKYEQVGEEIMVTANGEDFTAKFDGLDAGWYKLVESKIPDGYNKADDIYFKIEAEEEVGDDGEAEVTKLTVLVKDANDEYKEADNFTVILNSAEVNTAIENVRGIVLPSTGGIGTTIFYTVGGLLVVAAVVLLITKKRMGKAE